MKKIIPQTVFSQLPLKVDLDLFQMQQTVNSVTNWMSEYDQLVNSIEFHHRIAAFNSEGVRVISVASTPTIMKVFDPDCTIAIPITGTIRTLIDGKWHSANAGDECIFFAPGKRHVEGGIKSVILLSIPKNLLLSVASTMLAKPLQVEKTKVLALKHNTIDFLKPLIQLCGLIDQFRGNSEILKNFSIKDSLVRIAVMMLEPSYLQEFSSISSAPANSIDLLCEYISANLDQPLSLSTLEKVAGLSARTIQLEFKKKFACTPTQWIRQQRIGKAFLLLKNPTPTMNVSQVAVYCGYANFSDFARHYAQQCGELPSETLLKNK